MAQHDYTIANAAGATVRADINNVLSAIVSQNSGAAAPSPSFAFQWWMDTTNDILKQRNAANSVWIELIHFDQTGGIFRIDFDKGADIASAATTDIGAATGNYVVVTGTTTITAFGTIKAGTHRWVRFAAALTLTHNGTSLILPGGANITTAAGDMMLAISEGGGNWRVPFYQRANGQAVDSPISMAKAPPKISNGTDATNDIDIAVGKCRDDADTANLVVASAIGKQIDVTWAAGGTPGTPTGGLSSTLTLTDDTWYHVILGLVSGSIEAGFDTSITGANLVTDHSFTNTRRIGSVRRGTATNLAFVQFGDEFRWVDPPLDVNTTAQGTTAIDRTLTVPTGIVVLCRFNLSFSAPVTADMLLVSSKHATDAAPSISVAPLTTCTMRAGAGPAEQMELLTNTSAQIRTRASAASSTVRIATLGWKDSRGRDA